MQNYLKILSLFLLVFSLTTSVSAQEGGVSKEKKNDSLEKPMVQKMDQKTNRGQDNMMPKNKISNRPMMMGIVTSLDGSSLIIESNIVNPKEKKDNKKISFLVETASAIFYQSKQEVSISSVKVGDKIMVEGDVDENKISATRVHLGDFSAWKNPNIGITDATGEPLVVARVKEVNQEGKTLTITNKNKETYTVKLEDAKIVKNGEESDFSKISKNDVVLVQGGITDDNVEASRVSIQSKNNGEKIQLIKRVGDFFSRLFKSKK